MIRPVVARRDDRERLIRLADVLVAEPDGRPVRVQAAELFAEFVGLSLIVLAGPGPEVGIATRDGAIATLRPEPGRSIGTLAVVLYQAWVVAKGARPD